MKVVFQILGWISKNLLKMLGFILFGPKRKPKSLQGAKPLVIRPATSSPQTNMSSARTEESPRESGPEELSVRRPHCGAELLADEDAEEYVFACPVCGREIDLCEPEST